MNIRSRIAKLPIQVNNPSSQTSRRWTWLGRSLLVSSMAIAAMVALCSESYATQAVETTDMVLEHLRKFPATKYLQTGGNQLKKMKPQRPMAKNVMLYQKIGNGHPILGATVAVTINEDGKVEKVEDDNTTQSIKFGVDAAKIDAESAKKLVDDLYLGSLTPVKFDAELVWFRSDDDAAKLAWQVTTTIAENPGKESPTSLHTTLDAATGELISQNQFDMNSYTLKEGGEMKILPRRIVINDGFGAAGAQAYGADNTFRSVAAIGSNGFLACTGTLISPRLVITARHCNLTVGDVVSFGDNISASVFTTTVSSVFLPAGPGFDSTDGGDVALLRLRSQVPANVATPMRLLDETTGLVGRNAGFAGFGFQGLGSTGHFFGNSGRRWAGDNTIDAYLSVPTDFGFNLILTDFDNGTAGANTLPESSAAPLPREATTANGDSGGPLLVEVNDEPVIAGVLTGGTTQNSPFGDISAWTGIAIFRAQIEALGGEFVTEPAILEMEYVLTNPDTNETVPRVDLPGGGTGYRIYNHQQYGMSLMALQINPNPTTLVAQIGIDGIPFGSDLEMGDLYQIRYDEGWGGEGFVASASSPEFYLAESELLQGFDVPVLRNRDGQASAQFGSSSINGQALFLGSIQPMSIPADLIDVQLDRFAATDSWQNQDYPEDVNENGIVSPLDAIHVINQLNENSGEPGIVPFEQPESERLIDVNGDSIISPLDAILVINELNSNE